ncbi:HlyC/CorC family transporter [Nostocaceae cyanobacterium CENA369]|uniref:HlyC/CorC family transporter n=1 Tax=Dendronalium phyllosphericum CENA369 TaxID=1725256 RepID=A0A8J7HZ57_9NOST|nr:hemolysin family protein [Dendronalium phyllosphericum]MBH8571840.1 HlyC/CorC family transporter [Dendronalium phyllosphericum CENA369]
MSFTRALAVSGFSGLIWTDVGLRLLSVLLLIAINAFFVTAEFSIVTVRRSRIHQLVKAGDIPAIAVETLQRGIDRLLSTTQLGITLSSLALGWIGENSIVGLVNLWVKSWPLPAELINFIAHSLSIPLAFFLIAYLQIVLGELCPKSVAMLYSEELARFLGPSVKAIVRFFRPFIWILNQSTRYLLRLFGIEYTGQSWRPPVTPEELRLIISTERESTGLELSERELLNNIFEFGGVTAQDVMIPRTSIIALETDASFQTLLQEMTSTGHSCYPIIGESLDDISGIVYFKDLAQPLAVGKLTLETQIKPWIRPVRFVPEHTLLSELLPMMQQEKPAMVMVVNEFGATVGLVTIQDVIAEIIGNAGESEGNDDLLIQMLDKQTFLVQAQINLEDLNEVLHLNLPLTKEYQTLGGFLLYELQKMPSKGETFLYENIKFTIVSVIGPRLHQIQLQRLGSAES